MDEIDAIKNQLKSILGLVVQRGEISPDIRRMLRQAVDHARDRIIELQHQKELKNLTTVNGGIGQLETELWNLSGGQPGVFQNYLQTYPNAQLNQLSAQPTQLGSMIGRLQQQVPIDQDQQADGIDKAQLQSSNVYGFNYDRKRGKMWVRFNSGSIYEYDQVPPAIFQLVSAGAGTAQTTGFNRFGRWWRGKKPSLGASMHQIIKLSGYPFKRLK